MKNFKGLAILSMAALLGLAPNGASPLGVLAEEASIEGVEIEDAYNIGDYLFIPKSATIKEGDKSAKVISSVLTYPDGKSLSSSSYKLDTYGTYSLKISGEDNLSYSKSFSVYQDVYSFSEGKSSIDYGALNYYFTANGYPNGLKLEMAEGDTFTFARPVDLTSSSYQKIISWNVLDKLNYPAVSSISVRITDAYDPNNYFVINNSKGTYYYMNYVSASYNGGRSVGLDRDDSGPIVIGDSAYRTSSSGGTIITANSPISGVYNNISYYLDTSDPSKYKIYVDTDQASEHLLVAEFNNSDMYSTAFPGLKSGLAYISLTASAYSGIDYAPIEIAEIAGIKGDELNPMDYYKDAIAPLIDINCEEEANIMGGVRLAIPSAKAYDETALRGEVSASVWYGYDSSSRSMVSVSNNSFLPEKLGVYSIIYEAEDVYGNIAKKRVDLSASSFGEEGISFKLSELPSIKAGTSARLDNFSIVSLNDDAKVSIKLTDPDGVIKTLSSDEEFLFEKSGRYHAVYSYNDSFYSGEKELDFEVSPNSVASFESKEVAVPHYFMKGASYTVDVPDAYIYGSEGKRSDEIISEASIDGGEYVAIDPSNIEINGSTSMRLRFYPKSNPSEVIDSGLIPIVDTGWNGKKVDLTKYFVGDFTSSSDSSSGNDYIRYTSKTDGEAKMEFINKLLLTDFFLTFKAPSFTSVTVRLTSFYNPSKKVEITFEGSKVKVDGRSQTASESFTEGTSIIYSASNGTISVGGVSFDLANPFENDALLLEVEGKGGSAGDYIDIYKVGNQTWTASTTRDRVAPMASATFPAKIAFIGDSVSVGAPNIADVLTPASDVKSSLSVLKNVGGNTSFMKDDISGVTINGISDFSKDYQITLDEYGSYVITYSIADLAGNNVSIKDLVSVLDKEVPTMEGIPETHTIASGVYSDLPLVSAKDNITSSNSLEIWHIIYDSGAHLVDLVQNGDQVRIDTKGTYQVYVTCEDEEGNIAYGNYTLIVE
jgi:hypothetical protein